jgi:hypothetical protein
VSPRLPGAGHQRPHQLSGQPAAAVRGIGADRADLRPPRRAHPLAGHRDQGPRVPHAQVAAQLVGAPAERTRPGPPHQVQHLRHVGRAELDERGVEGGRVSGRDGRALQLDAVDPARPAASPPGRPAPRPTATPARPARPARPGPPRRTGRWSPGRRPARRTARSPGGSARRPRGPRRGGGAGRSARPRSDCPADDPAHPGQPGRARVASPAPVTTSVRGADRHSDESAASSGPVPPPGGPPIASTGNRPVPSAASGGDGRGRRTRPGPALRPSGGHAAPGRPRVVP